MNIVNIILAVLLILALVSYLYFKTKQFRTSLPIRKKWYKNRAGQSLSSLLIIFGVNQIILYPTTITVIVCSVLILVGSFTIVGYSKRVKHYEKFVAEEHALNH